MPRRMRVLDTNILIVDFRGLKPYDQKGAGDARDQAKSLIHKNETDAIVSPIEVEFLVGIVDRHEMALAEAFLAEFRIIDEHNTLPRDYEEARRVAKHIGHHARPRDLGDCLIDAICERLKADVLTNDRGLLRQHGRTRQRRN